MYEEKVEIRVAPETKKKIRRYAEKEGQGVDYIQRNILYEGMKSLGIRPRRRDVERRFGIDTRTAVLLAATYGFGLFAGLLYGSL